MRQRHDEETLFFHGEKHLIFQRDETEIRP
jgi:hypothetical protein